MSGAASERRLTALAYVCLLIVGVNGGWTGPFLPEISRTLHVAIDDAGLIISASAFGYFLALMVAGAISHRWSAHHLLVIAMVLFALGLVELAFAPRLSMLLCGAVTIGLGNGTIDVAANAIIVDLNRDRLASALNYLHVLFGVGALLGPIIAGLALAHTIGYWWMFGAGAIGCAMVAIALLFTPAIEIRVPAEPSSGIMPLIVRPIIWIQFGVLFLYVGGEAGIGAWLFLYLRTAGGLGPAIASSGVSIYWLGLIVGRMTGGGIAHRMGARESTIAGSVISAVALIGLIAFPRWYGFAALMIFLVGFGYGPIFPNMVAIGAEHFPARVGQMTSIIISGGAFGGMLVPWLMGRAMATATPRISMELAFAITALMAILSLAVRGPAEPAQR